MRCMFACDGDDADSFFSFKKILVLLDGVFNQTCIIYVYITLPHIHTCIHVGCRRSTLSRVFFINSFSRFTYNKATQQMSYI